MTGLLCCSVPPVYPGSASTSWRPHEAGAEHLAREAAVFARPGAGTSLDQRTVEWVAKHQQHQQQQSDRCRLGQCGHSGQDCGDGFCYNVWNKMVHV